MTVVKDAWGLIKRILAAACEEDYSECDQVAEAVQILEQQLFGERKMKVELKVPLEIEFVLDMVDLPSGYFKRMWIGENIDANVEVITDGDDQ